MCGGGQYGIKGFLFQYPETFSKHGLDTFPLIKTQVINQNKKYNTTEKVVIETEKAILQGRDIDRKKISMADIDYNEKIDGKPLK